MSESILDTYDNRHVDSTWLGSFCEHVTECQFAIGRVRFVLWDGQWIAYIVSKGLDPKWPRQKLVEVNYRFEVTDLLRALKIKV